MNLLEALRGGAAHDAQERAPIHQTSARQVGRVAVVQAQFVGGNQHVTGLINAPAAGPAVHLEDFAGRKGHFEVIAAIGFTGQRHAAEAEIDPGGQAHRGHHYP